MNEKFVFSNEALSPDCTIPERGSHQTNDISRVTCIKSKAKSIPMTLSEKEKYIPRKHWSSEDWTSPPSIKLLPHTFAPGWKFLRNDSVSENAVSTYPYSEETTSFQTLLKQKMCCQRLAMGCWFGPYYFLMYLIVGIMLLVMIIVDFCSEDFITSERVWFRTIHMVVVVLLGVELLVRITAIQLGRVERLVDLFVISLAVFTLSLYWTAPDMYLGGAGNSSEEIFLVVRYIVNILCMGYLFTKHLQRQFYKRVCQLGSYEDHCHRRGQGYGDIQSISDKINYNTFKLTGISSLGTRDQENVSSQYPKKSNSKTKHVSWSNLKIKEEKNYRPLKKAIYRGRVP